MVRGKKINEQAAVDAMAKAINDAVAGLSVKDPVSDTDSSDVTDTTDSATSSGSADSGENNPSTSDVAVTASLILVLCAVFVAMTLTLQKRNG